MNRIIWWLLLYPPIIELCSFLQFLQRVEFDDEARFWRSLWDCAVYWGVAIVLWRRRNES